MLTPEELVKKWELSWMQYCTIDLNKYEHIGSLVQGFLGVKIGEVTSIIPFNFSNEKGRQMLINFIKDLKTDYLGISFVQHYIHYS